MTLQDWSTEAHGKAEVLAVNRMLFESVKKIDITTTELFEDKNTIVAELQIGIDGGENIKIVDIIGFDSERKITDEGLQNCASQLHPENSIFMTSRATIGAFCINKIPVATNQGFIVSRPNNPNHLYYIFLNYRNRVDEFIQNANGSTFLEISRGNFRQLPILIPSPKILDDFHTKAKLLFENIFNNEEMIDGLTQTRDALLPKLMSGEIRV